MIGLCAVEVAPALATGYNRRGEIKKTGSELSSVVAAFSFLLFAFGFAMIGRRLGPDGPARRFESASD
jgi:hypothetical protein